MAHAWKACWVKALGGSNPPSSAEISHHLHRSHHLHHRHSYTARDPPAQFDRESMFVTEQSVVRIVPRRSLLVSALVSIVVVLVPVSAVLYWFAIPRGLGVWVAVAQAIVVGASITLLLRQLTIDTVVADGELRGRGIFSPMVRVPLEDIATVDIVPVYVGQSPETVPQLLVRDAAGRRLFRLRGTFWHAEDLAKVAEALPVPARIAREPISFPEFFAAYPGSAYWFENRPWLMAAILGVVILVSVAVVVGVMTLLGMPIMA
jgi:hypothetical protein